MRTMIALGCSLLLAACPAAGGPAMAAAPVPAPAAADEGGSVARAVVIQAASERDGVAAEYDWLARHLPGAVVARQALLSVGDRQYDRIDVVLPGGGQRSVYFDVTGFFGRF